MDFIVLYRTIDSRLYRLHRFDRILQVRILEWVAIPFSRGSSQARE